MNRILSMIVLVLLLSTVMVLSGCIDSQEREIEGKVNNARTEPSRVKIYSQPTGTLTDSVVVEGGSNVTVKLYPGNYKIEAYKSDEVLIGSTEFTLKPNDSVFYITVWPYEVTARSN